MGLNKSDEFSVVHWLSEDAPKRTKDCDQCVPHLHFIDNVNKIVNSLNKQKIIYIVTAEKNTTILNDFTLAGFSLLSNIILSGNSSSVDIAVVELGLLVDSTHQIFWGQGLYKTFADIIISQNLKQFRGP